MSIITIQNTFQEEADKISTKAAPMTPSDLKHVLEAEFTHKQLTQTALLQHWLNTADQKLGMESEKTSAFLRSAIIIGLDAEWYEHDASYITELGVSILDPEFQRTRPCAGASASTCSTAAPKTAWDMLSAMENHHVRIKPHAHLTNRDLCPSHPDAFQFGSTSFASISSARAMLEDVFTRRDSAGSLRPVIFLGHAVDNDAQAIKERFGIDMEDLGSVVATLDTQVLAVEAGIAARGRKMGLSHLLEWFGLEERFLHNAGNDVVATLVAALLIVCTPPPDSLPSHLSYASLKSHLAASNSATAPHRTFCGQLRFCIRCGSGQHTQACCEVAVFCEFCAVGGAGRREEMEKHAGERCREVVKANVLGKTKAKAKTVGEGKGRIGVWDKEMGRGGHACPCQSCIESSDPKRFGGSVAYGHLSEECPWGGVEV
ncbi:qde-2-interacting protein [Stemphylium lycopersici]|nr:qde-2-interacting protein [Stemphylium lycopersici]